MYNYDRLHHSNQLLVCSSVASFGWLFGRSVIISLVLFLRLIKKKYFEQTWQWTIMKMLMTPSQWTAPISLQKISALEHLNISSTPRKCVFKSRGLSFSVPPIRGFLSSMFHGYSHAYVIDIQIIFFIHLWQIV